MEGPRLEWGRGEPFGISDRWPRDAAGQPVPARLLCHRSCVDMADRMLVNMLEAYGIPCVRDYPGNGAFGRVIMGASGTGVDIYVPKSMLEEAKMLIEGVENDEEL